MGGRPSYPSSSCLPLPWVPPGRPQKLTSGGGGASGLMAGRVPSSEHVPREAEGAAESCHPECLARDPGHWSGLTGRWPLAPRESGRDTLIWIETQPAWRQTRLGKNACDTFRWMARMLLILPIGSLRRATPGKVFRPIRHSLPKIWTPLASLLTKKPGDAVPSSDRGGIMHRAVSSLWKTHYVGWVF